MVLVLAFAEQGPTTLSLPLWDKAVHTLAYAVLGLLSLRAAHGGFTRLRWPTVVLALFVTVGFGAFDEWNQTRFAYRHASVGDFAADSFGALAAVSGLGLWTRRRQTQAVSVRPID